MTDMKFKEINPSPRTLMTPGPVEADPRVLRAMGAHVRSGIYSTYE